MRKNYQPFHPALPNPIPYLEHEEAERKKQRVKLTVCILLATLVGSYLIGVAIFSLMPVPV